MRVLMFITIAIALIAVASLQGAEAAEELDVRITHDSVQTNETDVFQGDLAHFHIWIFNENASGLTQTYDIDVKGPNEEVTRHLNRTSLTVEYREEESVRIGFEPSMEASTDEFVYIIRVESTENENVTDFDRITLNVLERPDEGLTVEIDRRRVTLEIGQTGFIHLNITNDYDGDRELVLMADPSNNSTDAFIERDHTIEGDETLHLIMYLYGDDLGDSYVAIYIIPTGTPEFSLYKHVNVSVVEDHSARERRESDSPSGPAFYTVVGFTIGCLIAMFVTIILLKDRFPRH